MKTWAKAGIGCLAILLILCCVSAVLFLFAGAWAKHQIGRWTGGALGFGDDVQAMQALDRRYPFTPPASGAIDDARLRVYLSVCAQAEPVIQPYERYMRNRQGQDQTFKDLEKIAEMTAAVTAALRKGLEANGMGPSEFAWINQMLVQAEQGSGPNIGLC